MKVNLITELFRIKEIMHYNSNEKQILLENPLRVLGRVIKSVAGNKMDDIIRLSRGNNDVEEILFDYIDKIQRTSADNTDTLFKHVNDLGNYNDEAGKIIRNELRTLLPEETRNTLDSLKNYLEENIDDMTDINQFMDEFFDETFTNTNKETKDVLKDMVSDESPTIKKALDDAPSPTRPRVPNQTRTLKTFEELFPSAEELSELQFLINQYYKTKGNAPEWMKNLTGNRLVDSRSQVQRVLSNKDAFAEIQDNLRKMTPDELESLIGDQIAKSNERVLEMAKDKSFMAILKRNAKKLPGKFKTPDTLKGWLTLAGYAYLLKTGIAGLFFGAIDLLAELGYLKIDKVKERLTKGVEDEEISQSGGIIELNDENEDKIFKALNLLNPSLINNIGVLNDDLTIVYSNNGESLTIIDNNGVPKGSYTINQINEKLTQ